MTRDIIIGIIFVVTIVISGYAILRFLATKGLSNLMLDISFSFLAGALLHCSYLTALVVTNNLSLTPYVYALINILSFIYLGYLLLSNKLNLHYTKEEYLTLATVIIISLVFSVPGILGSLQSWDARAMWLVKAKTFFYSDGFPNSFFLSGYNEAAHKDYPLGFSLIISEIMRLTGRITEQSWVPLFTTYWIMISLMLLGTIKALFRKLNICISLGFVLAFLLVGTYVQNVASGMADTALSFAFLCVITSFILLLHGHRKKIVYLTLACFGAILAINTKNEGYPFFIFTMLGVAFVLVFGVKRSFLKQYILRLLPVSLVIIPWIIWFFLKSQLNFSNDITSGLHILSAVDYLKRAAKITIFLGKTILNYSNWGTIFPLITCIILAANLFLFRAKSYRYKVFLPAIILIFQFIVYFVIYLLTPRDLLWHLSASAERLILHVHPSFLAVGIYTLYLVQKKLNLKISISE